MEKTDAERHPTYVKVSVSLRDLISSLNDTELRTLLCLGLRVNGTGKCWPSIEAIAEQIHRSTRMVQYALSHLSQMGLVTIDHSFGGRGRSNIYTLTTIFSYGAKTTQQIAPFSHETPQEDAPFNAKTTQQIAPFNEKGAISSTKTVQSAQAIQIGKKNHRRRTNKEEEIPTEKEKKFLTLLKGIAGWPFAEAQDLQLLRQLSSDFSSVDFDLELPRFATYQLDHPITKKSAPRLRLRTWITKASEYARERKQDEGRRGRRQPRSPEEFADSPW